MHPDVYKRPLLWVLAGLICLLALFYRPVPSGRDVSRSLPIEQVTVTGRVASFPVAKPTSNNVIVKVTAVDEMPAEGYVYARFEGPAPLWKDTVVFSGFLQTPYGADLPGSFSWRRYLGAQHIFAEIKTAHFVQLRPAALLWRAVRRLRGAVLQRFNESFPPDLAAIASGILLGEHGALSAPLYTAFQDSGAIHLLVASGGNVGFVTLVTLLLGALCGLRRRVLLAVALLTAGGYTLIAGADAPLVRAYLMAVCACSGYFLGRNSGVFQGLLVACLLILCFHPSAVFETGFQMSFLATLAIILCLSNYRIAAKWPRWVQFFGQIFLATLATQLVLLPVFTNVFYKVSLTGLVSNMVLVPFASGLMGLGFAYFLLSSIHLGPVLFYPCLWGLELFKTLVEFFASFRFSALPVTAWNPGSVAAYYLVLFLLFHLPQREFARKIARPFLAAALVCWTAGYFYSRQERVYLLSEWNRRAVIVQTKQREFFVFNSGLQTDKLSRALAALGMDRPTAVFSLKLNSGAKRPGVIEPFEEIWPGGERSFGSVRVQARWEMNLTKDGQVWSNTGYSGRSKDGISYSLTRGQKQISIGGQGRFVRTSRGKIVQAAANRSVHSRW